MTTTSQPVAPTTYASRTGARGARLVPVVAVGLLAALTACGGGGSASTSASANPSSSPAGAARVSGVGQAPAGTSGTVAAVSASNAQVQVQVQVQVQNPTDGQVTVNFSATTRFTRTVPATRARVTVGSCVTVTSTNTASPSSVPVTALTAQVVTVTPAAAGSCTAQGAGFGGFRGGAIGSPAPGASRSTPSPGARRAGNRVFGKVTSASAAGFVVQGRVGGRNGSAADVAVTVNPATTYTSTAAADKAAVTVGSCLTATGPSDSTGAVTARSVNIRPAGPGGCTVGRRFGGGAATGASSNG